MSRAPRPVTAVLVLLGAVALLAPVAGCAAIPGDSDVTVVHRVGDPGEPSSPPGPALGAGPLETVRGWIQASGAVGDRHEAARGFLTAPAAGSWDDGAAPTVIADRVDTVFADRAGTAQASVRIRGSTLGTVTATGTFVAHPGPFELVVGLVQQNGQWRISSLPPGTVVRHADLVAGTRPVRTWFTGTASGLPVAETRYLPAGPSRTVPARALDLLATGPSAELAPVAATALPPRATLRVTDSAAPSGATIVDAEGLGALDTVRRDQLTRQVVLTLAGVGVSRVRMVSAGVALDPARPEVGVGDVLAGLPPRARQGRDLPPDPTAAAPAPVPSVVVTDGRVRPVGAPVSGPPPDPSAAVLAAAPGPDGTSALVVPDGPGVRLLLAGPGADPAAVGVSGRTLTRPSWDPGSGEVWTVADGGRVVRVVGAAGPGPATPLPVDPGGLAGVGPLTALRVSPDGVRVVAVSAGRVFVGVVARDVAGGARIEMVRPLRPNAVEGDLDGILDAGWVRSDRIVAVGGRAGQPVAFASVDGLDLDDAPSVNLSPPVSAVAATPGEPLLVVDQGGLWSFPDDGTGVWRSVPGATSTSVPAYEG